MWVASIIIPSTQNVQRLSFLLSDTYRDSNCGFRTSLCPLSNLTPNIKLTKMFGCKNIKSVCYVNSSNLSHLQLILLSLTVSYFRILSLLYFIITSHSQPLSLGKLIDLFLHFSFSLPLSFFNEIPACLVHGKKERKKERKDDIVGQATNETRLGKYLKGSKARKELGKNLYR